MPERTTDARERLRLPADALRWRCDPALFTFETTADLQPEEIIGGQERAVRALDFGLTITQPAYNIFVTGPVGSGRTTYTRKKVTDLAVARPTPPDWVYVYNFQQPDQPVAITLPSGLGDRFRRDMEELVEELKDGIRKVLASEHFAARRSEALRSYEARINEIWQTLEAEARGVGFGLERSPVGVVPVAIGPAGEPLAPEVIDRLAPEQREALQERARALQADIGDALRQVRNLEREAGDALRTLEGEAARLPSPAPPGAARRGGSFARYRVNLLVDNSQTTGAPVVFETNPTYYNLIGKVEYRGEFGAFVTDFTMIKPGALHRANGGFLVLQLNDILTAPLSWEALKRALKGREIRIEHIGEQLGLLPSATLRPRPGSPGTGAGRRRHCPSTPGRSARSAGGTGCCRSTATPWPASWNIAPAWPRIRKNSVPASTR